MTTAPDEVPLTLEVAGSRLVAILHRGAPTATRGVVIVVGGPQYRAGSHRQFVLLSRHLAAAGIPVLRFDYRGIGDSDGPYRGFEAVGEDIGVAITGLMNAVPGVKDIVLWGLCDAASAALFYAHRDPRVAGLVLLNPWVRTDQGEAEAYLRHYYSRRLFDPALWRKVAQGRFSVTDSVRSLLSFAKRVARPADGAAAASASLPDRMADGLARFHGDVLLIMSGRDLTAREFDDAAQASTVWRDLLASPAVTRCDLAEADHTFSRREWRDQVAVWTAEWVRDRAGSPSAGGKDAPLPRRAGVR